MDDHKQVWVPDQGDGTYCNPIIHADYSDPDVIRVGKDFFMVASSFANMPGLPILHSHDLVNWRIINHVVERFPFDEYNRVCHGQGIWAPSIRYHDGQFWVFFGAPDEGIYMSRTEDPFDKWEPPVCVYEGIGLIDTCPFWDDNGQAYLVHAYANSRCGIKHRLTLHRMAADGTKLLEDCKIVFEDPQRHPTMEGPKMYKRNGYYYIFAPAGGVKNGWQVVLRSRNIWGPYEDKVVLHQGSTTINGPHQGGLVELESGESWFIHFQDKDAYGRIIHLQPVHWVDDWPLIGINQDEHSTGEPVISYRKPNVGRQYPIMVPATSDDFSDAELGLQWQWQANYNIDWYELHDSCLRLFSHPIPDKPKTLWYAPHLLLQKFPAPNFQATVKMTFSAGSEHSFAGLTIMGRQFAYLCLRKKDEGFCLQFVKGDAEASSEQLDEEILLSQNHVYLRVNVETGAKCKFNYSLDGENYQPIGSVFAAQKGHWIGAKVGVFCANKIDDQIPEDFVDFHWFSIE